MTTQVTVAADVLFPSEGNPTVANIKFLRGWDRAVCAEQLAAEYNRIEAHIVEAGIEPQDGIGD